MPSVDLRFRLTGGPIPSDHGYLLASAISRFLPALHANTDIAIHNIYGRNTGDRRLALTPYSCLAIRVTSNHISELLPLSGSVLRIAGDVVHVGAPAVHTLIPAAGLHSRLVVIKGFEEPEPFLEAATKQLKTISLLAQASLVSQPLVVASNVDKTGGSHSPYTRRTIRIHDKNVVGFAMRVFQLTAEESITLQEHGLGGRQRFGCGIFVPDTK
jgi:CRISPR-associated protein Cas6